MSSRISDSNSKNNRNNCITACENARMRKNVNLQISNGMQIFVWRQRGSNVSASVAKVKGTAHVMSRRSRCVNMCESDWKLGLQGTNQSSDLRQWLAGDKTLITFLVAGVMDEWILIDGFWSFFLLASPSTTDRYCEPQTLLKTNSPFSSCFTSEFVVEYVYENDKKNTRQRKRLKILKFFWLSTRVCASLIGLTFLWNCSFSATLARPLRRLKASFWPA